MNKKAKVIFALWVLIAILLIITILALISPLKDVITPVLGVNGLNCASPQEGYRGSCIVIKGSVLIFVFGIGYYIVSGLINKYRQ